MDFRKLIPRKFPHSHCVYGYGHYENPMPSLILLLTVKFWSDTVLKFSWKPWTRRIFAKPINVHGESALAEFPFHSDWPSSCDEWLSDWKNFHYKNSWFLPKSPVFLAVVRKRLKAEQHCLGNKQNNSKPRRLGRNKCFLRMTAQNVIKFVLLFTHKFVYASLQANPTIRDTFIKTWPKYLRNLCTDLRNVPSSSNHSSTWNI